jgi:hypothetical protein
MSLYNFRLDWVCFAKFWSKFLPADKDDALEYCMIPSKLKFRRTVDGVIPCRCFIHWDLLPVSFVADNFHDYKADIWNLTFALDDLYVYSVFYFGTDKNENLRKLTVIARKFNVMFFYGSKCSCGEMIGNDGHAILLIGMSLYNLFNLYSKFWLENELNRVNFAHIRSEEARLLKMFSDVADRALFRYLCTLRKLVGNIPFPEVDDFPLVREDIWDCPTLSVDPCWDFLCFESGIFCVA